jgi:palmitoyltransferase
LYFKAALPPLRFQNNNWKLCVVCEAVTPPRAWHCNVCNICILKREHHCMFVGYCVGHQVPSGRGDRASI